MTTIGLSYSLVKISTKCAPALYGKRVSVSLLKEKIELIPRDLGKVRTSP